MSKRDNRDEIISKRVQAVIKEKQDKEQQELNKLHIRIPQLTKEEEDSLIESVENLVVQYYWTLTSAYDTHYFFITDDVFEKCETFMVWLKKYYDLKERAFVQTPIICRRVDDNGDFAVSAIFCQDVERVPFQICVVLGKTKPV
jgi:hypothetical protein